MTDLPYGRGGHSLQNLIMRGHESTMISAFALTEEMDGGPIYEKCPLYLEGRAQDIYIRAASIAMEMAIDLAEHPRDHIAQEGETVYFERRNMGDSQISVDGLVGEKLYDFARMLDAETYPHAWIEYGGMWYEFTHAELSPGGESLIAKTKITPAE